MLILSRGEGEEIIIGGNVTVKIVRLKSGVVKLGIEAPPNVTIDRKEVHESKRKDKR